MFIVQASNAYFSPLTLTNIANVWKVKSLLFTDQTAYIVHGTSVKYLLFAAKTAYIAHGTGMKYLLYTAKTAYIAHEKKCEEPIVHY